MSFCVKLEFIFGLEKCFEFIFGGALTAALIGFDDFLDAWM